MKIAVIGTGYVGLTTGACLAQTGNEVICVDIDEDKIEKLKKAIIPIYEPGLEEIVQDNIKSGRLVFTTDTVSAIKHAEVVISAVGTPPDKDYRADLSFVKEVASQFGKHIDAYKVFVNKSTVPVGTGEVCRQIISDELKKRGKQIAFDIISNPEFLKEGTAISDTMYPDRIVIGYESDRARDLMEKMYKGILDQSDAQLVLCDIKSAEIIKYASNSFLAAKITFINEIANFCELVGGDVMMVAKGMGIDKRIGKEFLNAGIGYGGSCFPKDVKALIQTGKDNGYDFKMLEAVENVNEKQKEIPFVKVKKNLGELKGKKIAIWGLSFKPNTDDMRDASSLTVINKLLEVGAHVYAYDPVAMDVSKRYFNTITLCTDMYEALEEADALIILTEWDEFKKADLRKVLKLMKGNLVIDGRNIFEKEQMKDLAINYISIGRPLMLNSKEKTSRSQMKQRTASVSEAA